MIKTSAKTPCACHPTMEAGKLELRLTCPSKYRPRHVRLSGEFEICTQKVHVR